MYIPLAADPCERQCLGGGGFLCRHVFFKSVFIYLFESTHAHICLNPAVGLPLGVVADVNLESSFPAHSFLLPAPVCLHRLSSSAPCWTALGKFLKKGRLKEPAKQKPCMFCSAWNSASKVPTPRQCGCRGHPTATLALFQNTTRPLWGCPHPQCAPPWVAGTATAGVR